MIINNPGHMTKMAAMRIYGTNPSKLLQNRWTDFNETWHVASGIEYQNVFINHCPVMTVTLPLELSLILIEPNTSLWSV